MLDEGFAEAWVNSTHRVLGLKLQPFSLWHRFQLEILKSPVLKTGEAIPPLELERACLACRVSYPMVLSPKINMWSFRWRLAGRNYSTEVQKFFAYLADYFAIPQFLPQIKKRSLPESINHPPPETMQIYSAIATMTSWPEEKIWNLPIGQAYWYAAGQWYQAGHELDFLTPEHLVLQQRIAAMKAKKNA